MLATWLVVFSHRRPKTLSVAGLLCLRSNVELHLGHRCNVRFLPASSTFQVWRVHRSGRSQRVHLVGTDQTMPASTATTSNTLPPMQTQKRSVRHLRKHMNHVQFHSDIAATSSVTTAKPTIAAAVIQRAVATSPRPLAAGLAWLIGTATASAALSAATARRLRSMANCLAQLAQTVLIFPPVRTCSVTRLRADWQTAQFVGVVMALRKPTTNTMTTSRPKPVQRRRDYAGRSQTTR